MGDAPASTDPPAEPCGAVDEAGTHSGPRNTNAPSSRKKPSRRHKRKPGETATHPAQPRALRSHGEPQSLNEAQPRNDGLSAESISGDRCSSHPRTDARRRCSRWWARLPGACPISLELLRTMPYPPFELRAAAPRGDEGQGVSVRALRTCSSGDFYDPTILAAYLVSTGSFLHPTSRRPIEREECIHLDVHLSSHCYRSAARRSAAAKGSDQDIVSREQKVTHAFDHRHEYGHASRTNTEGRLASDRREAEVILQALFANSSGLRPQASGVQADANRDVAARGGRRGRTQREVPQASTVQRHVCNPSSVQSVSNIPLSHGMFTVVDDDLVPSQLLRSAPVGADSAARTAADEEDFPALPSSQQPLRVVFPKRPVQPTAQPLPSSTTSSTRLTSDAREGPAASSTTTAALGAHEKASDPAVDRRHVLAAAFGRDLGGASSFAGAAAARFSAETLALARSDPSLVARLETAFDDFLTGCKPRLALWPMLPAERALTQELAAAYQLATGVYAAEGKVAHAGPWAQQMRSVHLFRTETCGWPGMRLSDAAAAPPEAVAPGDGDAKTDGAAREEPSNLSRQRAAMALPASIRGDEVAIRTIAELRVWHETQMARVAAKAARAEQLRRGIVERCVASAMRVALRRALQAHASAPRLASAQAAATSCGSANGELPGNSPSVPAAAAWRGGQRLALRREAAAREAAARVAAEACNGRSQACGECPLDVAGPVKLGGRQATYMSVGIAQPKSLSKMVAPIQESDGYVTPPAAAWAPPPSRRNDALTWGAVRRLIWSSPDELAAHETLRNAGLPTYARRRALDITGPSDAHTRMAAGAEWHLQLVELLSHDEGEVVADGAAPKLDPGNPYAPLAEAELMRQRAQISRARKAEADEEARAVRAGELAGLLPRDFLSRQPKRWRKAQCARGVKPVAEVEESAAGSAYRRGLLLWGVHF